MATAFQTTGTLMAYGLRGQSESFLITNLPKDTIKVRIRFRSRECAKAFVKTPRGIEQWMLSPDGSDLKLAYKIGENRNYRNE